MKKAIGFLGGQFGDAITTIAAQKIFCEDNPDYQFTFALAKKYAGIMPLFYNQPHIHDYHLWEGYDNFPQQKDIAYLEEQQFDIVFNPMQNVGDERWMNRIHQVQLCCERYGLRIPSSGKINLQRYFEPDYEYRNCVGLSLFPNNGEGIKNLKRDVAQELTKTLVKKGYRVIQLGDAREPTLVGAKKVIASYFDSVKALCACKFLVTGDTGLSWVAAAYDIPVAGFYAYGYHCATTSINWQPVNAKAIYQERYDAKEFTIEDINSQIESLESLL